MVVTANGTPNLSATQSFNVVVNPLAYSGISSVTATGGLLGFTGSGPAGPDYAVQGSSNLVDRSTLFITNSPPIPFSWSTNAGSASVPQFYRVKAGPPLP